MKKDSTGRALSLLLALSGLAQGCTGVVEPSTLSGDGQGGKDGKVKPTKDAGAGDLDDDEPGDGDEKTGDDGVEVDHGIGSGVFALCTDDEEKPSPRLLRLLTRRELQGTLQDLLFVEIKETDIANLPLEPRVRGYDNNAAASVVTSRHVDEYMNLAQTLADKAVREKKGQLVTCQPSAPDCARSFVDKFGLRAFRRPLTSEERTRYEAMFETSLSPTFDDGLKLVIASMISSPSFLYRSEAGEKQSDGSYKLTPYEVASALSYLYTGTMPDQALLDAAQKGQLATKEQLEAQARRLLATDRAKKQLGEFSLQWLRSDNLLSAFKDQGVYPLFSDAVRKGMIEEQQRFFTDVVLTREGKFGELYTADYIFADQTLARYYGLNSSSNEFTKIQTTPESDRGGILGLGAVMAAHASSMESSPIKRGVFVRDRLLCQDLTPPPPSLDTTPPGLDPTLTTRERFAKHTDDPTCRGCHQFIDGIGFGLEGFDGAGMRRTEENKLPIDISGEIVGVEGLSEDDEQPFEGQRQLAAVIAESDSAKSCLTLQYYRYARGYAETEQDACSLSKLKERFDGSDLTVRELLVGVALLDSFTLRQAR